MNITVIGRGNIGGGLADLWQNAGHSVTRLGREGGDVTTADALLLAVPGSAVESALSSLEGLSGKPVLDATNLYGATTAPEGFASNAEFVKSITGGPTAKAFSTNFAALFQQVQDAKNRPSNLWAGDDEIAPLVAELSNDAGYESVRLGDLSWAATQENMAGALFSIAQSGLGPFVYRIAPPHQL